MEIRKLFYILSIMFTLAGPCYASYMQTETVGGGSGDMTKAVYDTNANNQVDTADDSDDVTCTGCVTDSELASTFVKTETDPSALKTADTDNVKDTHIDWGTGATQVSADDVPDGSTNIIPTATQETNWDSAYSWGDHSTQNYLDKDTDPYVVSESDPTVDTADEIEAILTNDDMDFGTGDVTAYTLNIPATVSATQGAIDQAGDNLIHTFTPAAYNGTWGQNIFIGRNSGNYAITSSGNPYGQSNYCMGEDSCAQLDTGYMNNCHGFQTCYTMHGSADNVAIGTQALAQLGTGDVGVTDNDNTNYIVAIGNYAMAHAGYDIRRVVAIGESTGDYLDADGHDITDDTVFVGTQVARYITDSVGNTFIGHGVMTKANSGTYTDNTLIGRDVGSSAVWNNADNYNTVVGAGAWLNAAGASHGNSIFGWHAGDTITTGDYNILIGYDVDTYSATADGFMSIGNLIFSRGINGTGTAYSTGYVGIKTNNPSALLDIGGGSLTTIDGVDDLLVKDDMEIDGDGYIEGALKANDYYSGDGTQGITDSTSFWMCTAADCSTKCQVIIKDGLITACT